MCLVTSLTALSSCVTAPNTFAREWAQQLAAAPSCTIDLLDVTDSLVSTWRHMESRGFSLCIPADWRLLRRPTVTSDPYGRGMWRSANESSSFQWRVIPGAAVRECGIPIPAGAQARTWYETIGDEEVCIIQDRRTVRAHWDDGLVMIGLGRDVFTVEVLLSVIRTVRITGVWETDTRWRGVVLP